MSTSTRICVRRVLFPTDFSPESVHAVPYVRALQRRYHASVDVVHVLDVFPFSLSSDAAAVAKIGEIRGVGSARMQEFMRAHGFTEKEFQSALLTGEISNAVDEFAREHLTDVIVLGSHGEAGINRLFQGSMAEEIFRTAQCPVMVVGPRAGTVVSRSSFDHLFFPTDLGQSSKAALPYLEFMLSENDQARVSLAHFVEQDPGTPYERHRIRRHMERQLTTLIAPALRPRIEDVAVEFSTPAEGMISMATGWGADLLVLGVRQGGAFTRASTHGLLSITYQIISQAPCPVLTVRGA